MIRSDKRQNKVTTSAARIYPYLAPHSLFLVVLCTVMILNALAGLVPAIMIGRVIDVLPTGEMDRLILLIVALVGATMLTGGLGVLEAIITTRITQGVAKDIRIRLATTLHKTRLAFFASTPAGHLTNRLDGDVENLVGALRGTIIPSFSAIISVAIAFVAMCIIDWRYTAVTSLVLSLYFLAVRPAGERLARFRRQSSENKDEMDTLAQETLSLPGVVMIKSFNQYGFERDRISLLAERVLRLRLSTDFAVRGVQLVLAFVSSLGPTAILLLGGWLILHHQSSVGAVVTFLGLQNRFYAPAGTLAGIQVQLATMAVTMDRIEEVYALESESGGQQPFRGIALAIKSVAFGYGEAPVFRDLSLEVEPGQTIALIGASGSGKTTLARLLLRFYDPDSGDITLAGTPIAQLPIDVLRSVVGYVSQDVFLFTGTVADNLRYAKRDASDVELREATTQANIFDKIESLPQGFDTPVGALGARFSGGERQRIALARVLLQDPELIILDEATSSLDIATEEAVRRALGKAWAGRTIITITHKSMAGYSVNRIIELKDGLAYERDVPGGPDAIKPATAAC